MSSRMSSRRLLSFTLFPLKGINGQCSNVLEFLFEEEVKNEINDLVFNCMRI